MVKFEIWSSSAAVKVDSPDMPIIYHWMMGQQYHVSGTFGILLHILFHVLLEPRPRASGKIVQFTCSPTITVEVQADKVKPTIVEEEILEICIALPFRVVDERGGFLPPAAHFRSQIGILWPHYAVEVGVWRRTAVWSLYHCQS